MSEPAAAPEPGTVIEYEGVAWRPESFDQVEIAGSFTVVSEGEVEGRPVIEVQDARLDGELAGHEPAVHTYLIPAP